MAAIAFAFLLSPGLQANGQEKQGQTSPYVLRQRVEEVLLYCTVTDHAGRLITSLPGSAFSVTDDKKAARILRINQEDVPISLSLLLDGSASMKEKRSAVETAAVDVLRASNPSDETSLTNFADTAYVDQELTQDAAALQRAVSANQSLSGGTALFDTIIEGADHLAEKAQHSKQVIVIVTDGNDTASAADLEQAIKRVQRADGPTIYAIGLLYDLPRSAAARAHKQLQLLSEETGGLSFFPKGASEVDSIARELAKDIRSQYSIAFRPVSANDTGVYHAVAVQAVAPGLHGLRVRTRKGYARISHEASPSPKQP